MSLLFFTHVVPPSACSLPFTLSQKQNYSLFTIFVTFQFHVVFDTPTPKQGRDSSILQNLISDG